MKFFVDANILVATINGEYPLYHYTARILGLADQKGFQIYTTPVCLAIAFYFAEKRYGTASAKKRLHTLSLHVDIAATTEETVHSAFADPAVLDLEDGLEYFAALKAGCTCIVTEDKNDFHFSKIEVLSAAEFVERYILAHRF
ncbi:PIN domain-containing protein [Puia sp.]|jgi:predicted nucleic acid-binding protein|uniref:PIN domain-containing protein n=1 Tax=Puia sp. TaxID=2045100 RepID=UPI002F417BDC